MVHILERKPKGKRRKISPWAQAYNTYISVYKYLHCNR